MLMTLAAYSCQCYRGEAKNFHYYSVATPHKKYWSLNYLFRQYIYNLVSCIPSVLQRYAKDIQCVLISKVMFYYFTCIYTMLYLYNFLITDCHNIGFYTFYLYFQFYMSPQLALVGLTVVPPIAGIAILYGRYVRKITKNVQVSKQIRSLLH